MADPPRLVAPPAPSGQRGGTAPRISVLIAAYDAAATIADAVESALAQHPPPLEVIVSDDGSRDDLHGALRPHRSHVHVVEGPNAGLAVARNRAAAVAHGELLAMLDSDDVWLPGRTAGLAAAAAERPDLTVFTTDARIVRDGRTEDQTYYGTRTFAVDDQRTAILRENFIFGAGAVRTGAFREVGGYSAGARFAADWDLWLRMLLRGHRAGLVDEVLYEYRRRPESLTGRRIDHALGVLDLLAAARPLVGDAEGRRQLASTEQRWRERAARASIRQADPRARRLAWRAAVGRRATLRARARFATAALLPAAGRAPARR